MSLPNDVDYPDAPNGRKTRTEGEKYQEFVRKLLNPRGVTIWNLESKKLQYSLGENPQGFEIKLDKRCFSRNDPNATNRLSIEVQEKTRAANPSWVNSGILRDDNSWMYVQGNYEIVFVFAKNWLLRYYHTKITPEDIRESHGTVRKFYLKVELALFGATLVINGDGSPLRKDEKGQWRL